jgi:hypothetical protein
MSGHVEDEDQKADRNHQQRYDAVEAPGLGLRPASGVPGAVPEAAVWAAGESGMR